MTLNRTLFIYVFIITLAAQTIGAVMLGSAQTFAVLGGSTVTSTGLTALEGNLGVYPGTAITGFQAIDGGPGTFTGTSHLGDPAAQQAQADATVAFNQLSGFTSTQNLTGQDLGGMTLAPGVYAFDATAALTGTLILDGAGDYIFQIGSTLTTAVGSSVQFINGADPFSSVYWLVGSSSTPGGEFGLRRHTHCGSKPHPEHRGPRGRPGHCAERGRDPRQQHHLHSGTRHALADSPARNHILPVPAV